MTSKQLTGIQAPDGSQYATLTDGVGNILTPGIGSVTSVSVVTANGVSGSVATATSTPAITITLGAITPSTVTIGVGAAITSSGAGGALGSNAFTSTVYAPAASPTFTGTTTYAGALVDSGYSYQTPATGFSITLSNSVSHTILDPAGTLATGTITMPAAPVDGQVVDVRVTQIITSLTVSPNSGQSVKGNPTSTAVGSTFTAIYRSANTTWYF